MAKAKKGVKKLAGKTTKGAFSAKTAARAVKSEVETVSLAREAKEPHKPAVVAKKVAEEAVAPAQLPHRAKVSRRRQIDPTTCERDYTGEEIEFMRALDHYKRTSGRMFPTCSEILEVIRRLGYEKHAIVEVIESPVQPELQVPAAAAERRAPTPIPPAIVEPMPIMPILPIMTPCLPQIMV